MSALILDTETNDLNGYPIEIAYSSCSFEQGGLVINQNQTFDEYFSCPAPIKFGAMAVHHILESDIADKPDFSTFRLPENTAYLIGHNIDYDIQAVKLCDPSINVKGICTLALARTFWKNLDSHALGSCYYFVMEDKEKARKHLRHAHNAKADIYFTGVVLQALIEKIAVKDMNSLYQMSEIARIPTVMPFGKHKGTLIKELPSDYVSWLKRQPEVDQYVLKALKGL